ncbi:NADPH-dependent glutamate synthase [Anaerofustis stercorihominis]|uniref:Glutamate synthase (NADPH), homotetrameric n=3 Tax=Anaerofustis stercorihominis TaxID=214853 RepID=B1CC24_9FIRM|nr:NADPH-dependent glutamate synthase [Anaerofustis stercorihominis]EDS71821.1 glutamate synthase (NADPH), homotetrameric [Anaerofustis stercorihominis DSM 17244]MCQ4796125.1 NADPH-dependent glutamate synthase [Anaerofustis stercorihominis]RGD75101.1 NADPH-dependent glutamate synthase [Anaerofustis stercorihominis]
MINLIKEKNPMPEQKPDIRNKNFEEVANGYTEEMAINEAMRCLKCRKKPCMSGCPVMVKIPDFIAKIAEGEFEEAYQIIKETNSLPAICGRVCPQETQCEGKCVHAKKGEPVAIGRLERFAADWHAANFKDEKVEPVKGNGHKVAVVGAGPAGLACAGDLINKGYDVTVYESLHKTGGVLVYGIPEFRLPKEIVAAEVKQLEDKGVKFVTNAIIGKSITVDELMKEEGFESVFIGTGAGLPSFMNIPGENLIGVCSANEYLTRINLMKAYLPEYDTPILKANKIAVVGGGNVAMDAARCAKRMGAEEVYLIYRRSAAEIPARAEEIHHAVEEEIDFRYLTNPVKVLGDEKGQVCGIECVKMELGEPDASGRRRPVVIEGSNYVIDVDCVIMAIGTKLNKLILETTDNLEENKRGGIYTDDDAATNRPEIFAGGDAVTGAATVIKAMGAGKTAAAGIDKYFESKNK